MTVCDNDIDAVDPRQIDAADPLELSSQVELRRVAARFRQRLMRGRAGDGAVGEPSVSVGAATLSATPLKCCSNAGRIPRSAEDTRRTSSLFAGERITRLSARL
jgi:hypothetical protein